MQAQVRDADRLVIQIGRGLGERDGCTIVTLTDEQYTELRAALAQPNGGVVLDADGVLTVLYPPPEPETGPTRDERLLAAVEQATEAVQGSSAFNASQKALLSGVFAGLGNAIAGGNA